MRRSGIWPIKCSANALVLIDDFKITEAVAALRLLAGRLAASSAPGAPFELQKVDRLASELGGQAYSGRG